MLPKVTRRCPKSSDQCPNSAVVYLRRVAIFVLMQPAEGATCRRIAFQKLRLQRFGKNQCVTLISLARPQGGVRFGTWKGEDSATGQLECAAKATIRALEAVTEHRVEFQLEEISRISDLDTVLVHLSVANPAGDHAQLLCGSCLVNGDPLHAAARAVLKATNRLFEIDFIYLR